MDNKSNNYIKIMGVPFTTIKIDELMSIMGNMIEGRKRGYISITNTESMYHALEIDDHFEYINGANFSCCDGVGVAIAARCLGYDVPRLHGPDLMLKSCRYGVGKKWRHYFYGGRENVPEMIKENLKNDFTGIEIAGCYSPPFRELTEKEDEAVIKMINDAKPDILWVGLGLLKQEKWVAEHRRRLNVSWIVGVGAAFDFYAGTVKRAPEIFRNTGLEWLYRVTFEPRMIRRNILSFKLMLRILGYGFKNRKIWFGKLTRAK